MLDTAQNIFLALGWVALSIFGLILLNHFWSPSRRRVHNDVIGWQISILGTIYAVMIGFMLYAVWANFQTAETNADSEANALINLFRSADGLPISQRDAIDIAAVNYANAVVNEEFPTMHRNRTPIAGKPFVIQMWAIATQTQATNFGQQASLHQAMSELSSLTEHRRIRILEASTAMPTILWAVLVIGGVITIASSCLIGSENVVLHYALICSLSLLISLALIAIGDIDRPFQGSVHVGSNAFVNAQQTMLETQARPK